VLRRGGPLFLLRSVGTDGQRCAPGCGIVSVRNRGASVMSWDDREWRDEMNEMNEKDESARPVRPSRPFHTSQPIYRLAFFWSSRRSVS
jgi:hypothetical protein